MTFDSLLTALTSLLITYIFAHPAINFLSNLCSPLLINNTPKTTPKSHTSSRSRSSTAPRKSKTRHARKTKSLPTMDENLALGEDCFKPEAHSTSKDNTSPTLKRRKTSHQDLDENGLYFTSQTATTQIENPEINTDNGQAQAPSPTMSHFSMTLSADEDDDDFSNLSDYLSDNENDGTTDADVAMPDAAHQMNPPNSQPSRSNSFSSVVKPGRVPKMGFGEHLKIPFSVMSAQLPADACELLKRVEKWKSSHHTDPPDVITNIADMVLKVVPYFDEVSKDRTAARALNVTKIGIGQEKGGAITLDELLSLFPSHVNSLDSWLPDTLMESLIKLIAPPYEPNGRWFSMDGMLQYWRVLVENRSFCSLEELNDLIEEKPTEDTLPCRDIPEDARAMLFFYNPWDNHWMTVLAYVDPTNMKEGKIEIFNSSGGGFQYGLMESLPRLIHCVAHGSQNQLFANADWFHAKPINIDCPQQGSANIDCGVFSVNAALCILEGRYPDRGWFWDEEGRFITPERISENIEQHRRKEGEELREAYMNRLKCQLDLAAIANQTEMEMVNNDSRRWSALD